MAKVIFTPWKDHSDLLCVRSQFYPPLAYNGPDMRSNACATVGSWKFRGNLPHPVEATALLTDAILHDDGDNNSIFSIRATYSAAFCRFVTGLVDAKVHGQRKTMFQRAVDLGLPASFVELRHEATHRELPSLIVLRNAAQRSLEWLWNYYWSRIDRDATIPPGATGNSVVDGPPEVVTREILRKLEDDEVGEPPQKRRRKSRIHRASSAADRLAAVCKGYNNGSYVLSRALLDDSLLIPADRKLGDSIDTSLSKWEQPLQLIVESHPLFLTILTEEMAKTLTSNQNSNPTGDALREAVYMWLDHILKSAEWRTTRRLLSPAYILAICDTVSNHWTKLLRKGLAKKDGVFAFDSKTSIRNRPSTDYTRHGTAGAVLDGTNDLAEFGWQVQSKWDCRPLGLA